MKKQKSKLPKRLLLLALLALVAYGAFRYARVILAFCFGLYEKYGLIGIAIIVILASTVVKVLSSIIRKLTK